MKIAFVYPGQGVQAVGMAKDFFDKFDYAKDMVKRATDAAGFDMEHILFEENEDIHVTEYTQPALVTACSIMSKALEDKGIHPDITAGLSLGEYCALVTAGAMTFDEAVRLTRIRGNLMSSYVPAGQGTMAAIIGLPKETIEETVAPIEVPRSLTTTAPARSLSQARRKQYARAWRHCPRRAPRELSSLRYRDLSILPCSRAQAIS